ncbi:MAG TPA: type II secretion system protein GspK [Burkholderiaceae bacterium]
MALIAVLWMVAALSIIVTSLSQAVRSEARLTSSERQIVTAGAQGDAAIQMVLQEMAANGNGLNRQTTVQSSYRGQSIQVEISPLNGLVDINRAPEPLLANLLTYAGGIPPANASALAHAMVEWRSAKSALGRPRDFEALEDLLQVPGFDYDLYASIAPLATADRPGSGRVNPMAAPEGVLAILGNGNAARASGIAAARDAGQIGIDTTTLDGNFIDNTATKRFRLQARVPLQDGGAVVIARSVTLGTSAQDGLPWQTFRTEQHLEPAQARPPN